MPKHREPPSFRGRPRSLESIRLEALQSGKLRGSDFIEQVCRLSDPKDQLRLLEAAIPEKLVSTSQDVFKVLSLTERLKQGKPINFQQTEMGELPPDVHVNPGLWKRFQDYKEQGGKGDYFQFVESLRIVLARKVAAIPEAKSLQTAPEPKAETKVRIRPNAKPAPAPTDAEILQAEFEVSACASLKDFKKWKGWTAAYTDCSFFFRLPDGKLINSEGTDRSNADPYIKQQTPTINIKPAPEDLKSPVLRDIGGILKWVEYVPPKPAEPIKQGLELWNLPGDAPHLQCNQHCKCKIAPGGLTIDGIYVLPRKIED